VLKKEAELRGDAETTAVAIRDLGGEALPFFGDVGDFETARKLIEAAVDHFGRIDILVNNAGTFMHAPIWEMTEEQWDHVAGNKPKSAFNTIRHASPHMMKQKWGRVINCTSIAWLGTLDHCNYGAANAGVVGLTRAAARELWSYGITVNAYAPSAFTRAIVNLASRGRQMADSGTPIMSDERITAFEERPTAEGLAPFVAYLATEAAAHISGTVFAVRSFGQNGPEMGIFSEPELLRLISKKEGWSVEELIKEIPEGLLEGYRNRPAASQPK
jgi:3-oxoacyl-[acyl-carrier protein] reductase